jgi:hypothetical protein
MRPFTPVDDPEADLLGPFLYFAMRAQPCGWSEQDRTRKKPSFGRRGSMAGTLATMQAVSAAF